MIKRAIISGGVLAVLGLVFFGRNAVSYVRTSVDYVRDSVHSNVPVEFELQRARQMLKDLDPEIRKNMHLVAKEEVELKQLDEKIVRMQGKLDEDKQDILRLKGDLEKKDKAVFTYAGRKYTPDEVKVDLSNRFDRFKTSEATLDQFKKISQARQKGVEAARQKLEGWLVSKRQLQVEVENLEAKQQMLLAAKSTSNYNFDDSQLGHVKELVNDLRTRLDVEDRLVNADQSFRDEIPLREPTAADIVDQVTKHFAARPEAAELAKSE